MSIGLSNWRYVDRGWFWKKMCWSDHWLLLWGRSNGDYRSILVSHFIHSWHDLHDFQDWKISKIYTRHWKISLLIMFNFQDSSVGWTGGTHTTWVPSFPASVETHVTSVICHLSYGGKSSKFGFRTEGGKAGAHRHPWRGFPATLPPFQISQFCFSLSLSTQFLGSFSQAFLGFLSLAITSQVERRKHRPFLLRFRRPGTGFLPIRKPSESRTISIFLSLKPCLPAQRREGRPDARRSRSNNHQFFIILYQVFSF